MRGNPVAVLLLKESFLLPQADSREGKIKGKTSLIPRFVFFNAENHESRYNKTIFLNGEVYAEGHETMGR